MLCLILYEPLPWHWDCQAKVDGQKDTCTCVSVWVCVSVLLRWLGESRAGRTLIEAWNSIKANLSFLCLCLLCSLWHSVTHWLPHLSHHLVVASVSSSLFACISYLVSVRSFFLLCLSALFLRIHISHVCVLFSFSLRYSYKFPNKCYIYLLAKNEYIAGNGYHVIRK